MSRDRDTTRRSGDALIAVGIALVVLVGGAGVTADLASALASAMFGHGWVFLPIGDVPRLLGSLFAHAHHLAMAYPAAQRHLLAANGTLWVCIVSALFAYA